ncbi:hypothetical protein ACLB2K_020179 [Fragaria x ananassa]
MDREQDELQFLGILGIYKESFKIIYNWRKIFSQITLTLILPLSFIFLAHIEISNILLSRILHSELVLDETRGADSAARQKKLSDVINKEWATYWLFKAAYFTSMLVFGLLSTSAVVYTIASVYTSREITFQKIMSVVPRVWKRVMITFLCTFLAFFLYNLLAIVVLVLFVIFNGNGQSNAGDIIGFFLLILYVIGFVYMTIIWQLASVVSVLEETRGIKAMIKSKKLLRGNMWVATIIFFKLNVLAAVLQFAFQALVVRGEMFGTMGRVGFGVLCLLLLFKLILFALVIQTVLYFVCKSYHHEIIDKSALSDHLEVIYLGDYVPLKSKDVQLEQV